MTRSDEVGTNTTPGVAATWRGTVAHIAGRGGLDEAGTHLQIFDDGAVVVGTDGSIQFVGPFADAPSGPGPLLDHRGAYILPGFVDTHVHFPQVYSFDADGGGHLLTWLDRCVFPSEARLADPRFAAHAARDFVDGLLRSGTTCALVFGSQFPDAQEALFQEIHRRSLRAIVGRTAMTQGPAALVAPLDETLELCAAEISRWHPGPARRDRALVRCALVPRFALSFDAQGLRALADLWHQVAREGVHFTTHLSEDATPVVGEIAAVQQRFGVRHYLDVYDGTLWKGEGRGDGGFLGPRSIMAHGVHLHDDELRRLREHRTGIAHCPRSQLFLGSGTLPLSRVRAAGVGLGLGSDIGAGDAFSLAEVANDTFKVHMSHQPPHPLSSAELLHMLTLGGAMVLDWDERIGNFDRGKDADLVVIDPALYPPLARRLSHGEFHSAADRLFALLLGMGRDTIRHTVVRGQVVYSRP